MPHPESTIDSAVGSKAVRHFTRRDCGQERAEVFFGIYIDILLFYYYYFILFWYFLDIFSFSVVTCFAERADEQGLVGGAAKDRLRRTLTRLGAVLVLPTSAAVLATISPAFRPVLSNFIWVATMVEACSSDRCDIIYETVWKEQQK